ncbi:membrane protein [Tamlana nanhaiensis]|uniref:Membrane protein n=1 Tax=Neotamlana nanhaiensis TaxID=1382798 RepID=A0A0D7VXQ6_9FLAO|nr:RagB/SusD family nutrient uptake outer membrane protein [Tamlana nanhaiensis]KJD31574.1 membrane protein [Tamlana nanhaiensis]
MRTRIFNVILLAVVLLQSCDNYLDLRPENGTTREEFWQTKEDVKAAVTGIYLSLLNTPPSESDLTIPEYIFMYGELRGGMVSAAQYTSDDQIDMLTTNILPSNSLTTWRAFYRVINFCNTVIDLGPPVLDLDPTFTQEELNTYLAEALTIRAYMYFTLARTFKDVPLKLEATLSDEDNFQLPTTPQADIFAQVVQDLLDAEAMAVETYESVAENKGKITKNTINTMLTDVYLWQEDYDNALIAADKVITNTNETYELIEASPSWFTSVYARGNTSESIFELQYTTQNLNPFYFMFLLAPQYLAEASVLEDVFGLDFNDPENKDIRGERASMVPGTNEIYKYTGFDENNRKSFAESDTHWFIYRYADLLLMKAEALNELNRGEEALLIIEELREARAAIDLTEEQVTGDNKNGVRQYILAERARELAFEGKRWFDLLRNARKENYAYINLIINVAIQSAPANQQQTIVAKLQDPNSHYLPINEYELYTNKALVQNPFYK